jgi:hypothetical protein
MADVEARAKLVEGQGREAFGEDVGELGGGRYVKNPHLADGNPILDKVEVDLHVLRPLVLNGVGGEVHRTDVVTVDQRALGERSVELGEKLPEPGGLSHTVSNSAVLRLSTRAGDHRLALGRLGHKVAAQEDSVAGGGALSVRTPGPVGVSVDDKLGGRRPMKEEVVVDRAAEVAEEALESSEVRLSEIMHVKTYLLNCIGDVRPGEGEVLKGTSKTPICSGICHWVTLSF